MYHGFDDLILKYELLKCLNPKSRLLDYFTKSEARFLPNTDLNEEFLEKFRGDFPYAEEYVEDEEKKPLLGYMGGLISRLFTNYEHAIDDEIIELQYEINENERTEEQKETDKNDIDRLKERYILLKELSEAMNQPQEILRYFCFIDGKFRPNPEYGVSQHMFERFKGEFPDRIAGISSKECAHEYVSNVFRNYEKALEDKIIELQWEENRNES